MGFGPIAPVIRRDEEIPPDILGPRPPFQPFPMLTPPTARSPIWFDPFSVRRALPVHAEPLREPLTHRAQPFRPEPLPPGTGPVPPGWPFGSVPMVPPGGESLLRIWEENRRRRARGEVTAWQ